MLCVREAGCLFRDQLWAFPDVSWGPALPQMSSDSPPFLGRACEPQGLVSRKPSHMFILLRASLDSSPAQPHRTGVWLMLAAATSPGEFWGRLAPGSC